jgi:hypothetical protein
MNNLCFYCKEQGHSIDTCEKKVMADAQNAGCGSCSSLLGYCGCANPCGLHHGCGCGQAVPAQNLYLPQAQYPAQYPQFNTRRPQFNPAQFGHLQLLKQGFIKEEVVSESVLLTLSDSILQAQTQIQQQQPYQH